MKNKNLTTDSIKQLLNQSTSSLNSSEVANLRAARNQALDRHHALQHAPIQAWLTHHGLWVKGAPSIKSIGGAVLLAATLLIGTTYWQHLNDHEHSELDLAILIDDLPLDAYIDD